MSNVTMFGLGAGGGTGASSAGQRGAGVGLTGIGGVEALRAGPWIKAGGAGSGSRLWVGGRVWGCARLGVEVEEMMILLCWGYSRS